MSNRSKQRGDRSPKARPHATEAGTLPGGDGFDAIVRSVDAITRINQSLLDEVAARRLTAMSAAALANPLAFAVANIDLMKQDADTTLRYFNELSEAMFVAQEEFAGSVARMSQVEAWSQATHALD